MGKAWTSAEDKRLSSAVAKLHAESDIKNQKLWEAVAKAVGGGRTGPACLGRWMTSVGTGITRGNWSDAEDKELLRMFGDPSTPSWSKRAIALGLKFHGGVRRGGAETCSRYFLLKKNAASTARTTSNEKKVEEKKKLSKKSVNQPAKKGKTSAQGRSK